MNRELLKQLLVLHEDLRTKPYNDSEHVPTIGVGHNMQAHPLPEHIKHVLDLYGEISYTDCMELLDSDIDVVIKEISQFPWFENLSEIRQAAMCDMLFNLGLTRFLKFKHLLAALSDEDYERAADEMLDSKWASDVGDRAITLAKMIRNDESI